MASCKYVLLIQCPYLFGGFRRTLTESKKEKEYMPTVRDLELEKLEQRFSGPEKVKKTKFRGYNEEGTIRTKKKQKHVRVRPLTKDFDWQLQQERAERDEYAHQSVGWGDYED